MPVDRKVISYRGAEFNTFQNERGELFFFRKAQLMRGKPLGPYNKLEEVRRPATLLTLENISSMTGITVPNLRYHIQQHHLKAVKKTWWFGAKRRSGFLVHMKDIQEFMMKREITKYHDKLIEWDIEATEILGG